MPTPHDVVLVLESTSALCVFSFLVFWLIPNYRLDLFRQEVFTVRDELFDYARAGHISFSHPAYRMLRQLFNGFIRYAHRLTFYRVMLTMCMWKLAGHEPELVWTERWTASLTGLDEQTRSDLLTFHNRLLLLVVRRLAFGSPFLIAALVLTSLTMIFRSGVDSLRGAFRKSVQDTVAHVIDPRLLEEEAMVAAKAA